jgi:hypothetical protein
MLATAVFFVATSAVGHAHARTCESPDDCPMGFDCVGAGADGGPAGACYSLGCSAESDCGPGLRCASSGSTICIPEPEGGSSCSSNACVPQWDAPCTADVDCGPGFTCSGTGEDDEIACTPDAVIDVPAYATKATGPCPTLGFGQPSPCDGGPQYCYAIAWKTCVANPTPSCAVNSDCPAAWSCQCPVCPTTGDAGADVNDGACTKACLPPNADLAPNLCNLAFGGVADAGTTDGGSEAGDSAEPDATSAEPDATSAEPDADAAKGSPGMASSDGGCVIGADDPATEWPVAIIAALGWLSRRRLRARGRTRD